MQQDRRVSPLLVTLRGGVLDGDTFELMPQGSVLPPLRLSYAYRDKFPVVARFGVLPAHAPAMEEHACWLHYERKDHIPEWSDGAIIYEYVGKEKMKEDR